MKQKKLQLLTTFLLLLPLCVVLLGAGCDEKEDEIINIEPVTPDTSTEAQLNIIFSDDNDCLVGFKLDSICELLYNQEELEETDTCNSIPLIDFDEYSLIAGKVMVPGMVSTISDIKLAYNGSEERYKLEIFVNECDECYDVIGYLFFWRLYPKLEAGYDFDVIFHKN